mmetsp:Transcript_29470/g.50173  ORF Transcript_29470/g.50173 Transcript_29470/m.50173 type:complete len:157 (-) Transcript_29470:42-512(-)
MHGIWNLHSFQLIPVSPTTAPTTNSPTISPNTVSPTKAPITLGGAESSMYDVHEAGNAVDKSGVQIMGAVVKSFDNGDYVVYDNLYWGMEGDVTRISVSFAKGCCGGRIEARLDDIYGPVIGTFTLITQVAGETLLRRTLLLISLCLDFIGLLLLA